MSEEVKKELPVHLTSLVSVVEKTCAEQFWRMVLQERNLFIKQNVRKYKFY